MPTYGKVTSATITELKKIVGPEHVVWGESIPSQYAYDAGTKKEGLRYPEILVFPGSAQAVAAILKMANNHLIPVTPRGGGSGLAGGAVPLNGGIVLDLRRMNKIVHIDPEARYMVVEPAVRTIDIQQAANQQGLLYAGDPCSSDDCVIAGNIATNAGGNRAIKYGVTGDQVYELEVVTPQGEIVTLGGRLKKNSTGYGLVKLIAGSEGTLGIITQVTIKLQKLAPLLPNFLAVFPSLTSAISLVGALLEDTVIDPISIELIDRQTVLDLERYCQEKIFDDYTGDCLIIQFEAYTQDGLQKKWDELQKKCNIYGCHRVYAVDGEKIWPARRAWGKAIEVDHPVGVSEDIVVPVDQIASFVGQLEALIREFHFQFRMAGHAGDGNMHIRIVPGEVPVDEWPAAVKKFREKLYTVTYDLGGRLSGEHGIGLKRKEILRGIINPVELALMQAIKKAFDPNYILNPGKIFDMTSPAINNTDTVGLR
ncbi:FAD-binding oxidoreductase [Sporomusa sp. KB1]|jgi:glycolate oxidase|uniref:FAD-binding oxidoreductase n=1 Tax=Sporomusa sp. KB1 TaxID=943346 RepID=UPI00119E75E1|nr:FAD-binding oxidoreductase [Sporomusa sp. KB1]TWH47534.1 glycolate oxidase [Sporomusa sp. KB1]